MPHSKPEYKDFPIEQCIKRAEEFVSKGTSTVYQKFSCDHCGSRQTMGDPNVFHTHGVCEECKKVTDIKARGCNYMLHLGKSEGLIITYAVTDMSKYS